MSLNIKSTEADDLVAEISHMTGETKTQAVIVALRERLERTKREQDRQRLATDLLAIGARCAAYGRQDETNHGDLLYDELGLPR